MVDILGIIQQVYSYIYNFLVPIIGENYLQLFIFTFGLFIYSIFVWKFYKTLSKRDLFKIDLQKYNLENVKHKTLGKIGSVLAYILKYGIIFPVYIFIWFLVLSSFLILLSENVAINQILFISIVVVSTTRAVSYYKEDMSSDLAKLIPLALLAISLSNPNFFSTETTISRLLEISNFWSEIIQFLIFSIILEWLLRILFLIKKGITKKKSD